MSLDKIKNLLDKNNFDFYFIESVDSTMTEVKKLIYNRNICLMANEQKKGFGRRGTTWESPKNNVYISILSKNILPIENHFLNNAFITNMICSVIENICNVKTQIKWPNDILINNKKCGGVLCETRIKNNCIKQMVIGIGLNVNETNNDFPDTLSKSATSLAIETNQSNQRELLCAIITTYFERLLNDLPSSLPIWQNYCNHINESVSFNQGGINQNGIFKGLDNDGRAIIQVNKKEILFNSITLE